MQNRGAGVTNNNARDSAIEPPQGSIIKRAKDARVSVGDTVRVKYLADGGKELNVKISRRNPTRATASSIGAPLAKALLGAEEGDEVTVLIGNQVRSAKIEQIIRDAGVSTH